MISSPVFDVMAIKVRRVANARRSRAFDDSLHRLIFRLSLNAGRPMCKLKRMTQAVACQGV